MLKRLCRFQCEVLNVYDKDDTKVSFFFYAEKQYNKYINRVNQENNIR